MGRKGRCTGRQTDLRSELQGIWNSQFKSGLLDHFEKMCVNIEGKIDFIYWNVHLSYNYLDMWYVALHWYFASGSWNVGRGAVKSIFCGERELTHSSLGIGYIDCAHSFTSPSQECANCTSEPWVSMLLLHVGMGSGVISEHRGWVLSILLQQQFHFVQAWGSYICKGPLSKKNHYALIL